MRLCLIRSIIYKVTCRCCHSFASFGSVAFILSFIQIILSVNFRCVNFRFFFFSIGFGSLSRYIKQERGREIARVVIVACHDPPMSNYANTCVIPKPTNHKFSGYQSYTINTVMYTSPLYPFVPF